jgi:hypothetical protein
MKTPIVGLMMKYISGILFMLFATACIFQGIEAGQRVAGLQTRDVVFIVVYAAGAAISLEVALRLSKKYAIDLSPSDD